MKSGTSGRCTGLAAGLFILLPMIWPGDAFALDEGIPALLQFAEQYQHDTPSSMVKPAEPVVSKPAANNTAKTGKPTVAHRDNYASELREQQQNMFQQQMVIDHMERQITNLQKQIEAEQDKDKSAVQALDKVNGLSNFVKKMRETLAVSSQAQQAKKQLATARQQMEQANANARQAELQLQAIQQQLATANQKLQQQSELATKKNNKQALSALQQQVSQLTSMLRQVQQQNQQTEKSLVAEQQAKSAASQALTQMQEQYQQSQLALSSKAKTFKEDIASLQMNLAQSQIVNQKLTAEFNQQKNTLQEKLLEMQAMRQQLAIAGTKEQDAQQRVAAQDVAQKKLQKERDELLVRAQLLAEPKFLATAKGRQSYAAGVSFAQDIIKQQNQNNQLGADTDTPTLLSGIIDTFQGHRRLADEVLAKALAESNQVIAKGKAKVVQNEEVRGAEFIKKFTAQDGVKNAKAGFWFKVDYLGEGAIADNDIVTVVVKETLADGTVIQDMEVGGKILARPLADFPELFQEAIRQLQAHGNITMVVPPALAYGEKGYPPKVPPNATIIYNLRIDDVSPAVAK